MRIRFYTSTPMNVSQGSGTFTGITTLAEGLRSHGASVDIVCPSRHLPNYTLERLAFNRRIANDPAEDCDVTVGFDMDGYLRAPGVPHIAALKGVIADELQFESGFTRWSMGVQARREARHVQRARSVTTTSRYSARRIEELYNGKVDSIVPESIDLARWRTLLQNSTARPDPACFTLLCICRFYPRKRVDVLLRAMAVLRKEIPRLRLNIIGNGPLDAKVRALSWELGLVDTVNWMGDVSTPDLVDAMKSCDVFCLPSVQEGFGIVFLEAMAAGKPIVAVRAAAVPEVVPHALLAEPDSPHSLANQITILYNDDKQRVVTGEQGRRRVEQFDSKRVSRLFLDEVERLAGAHHYKTAAI